MKLNAGLWSQVAGPETHFSGMLLHVSLLQLYFSMDVLLQIYCIFSEHLFITAHPEGYF